MCRASLQPPPRDLDMADSDLSTMLPALFSLPRGVDSRPGSGLGCNDGLGVHEEHEPAVEETAPWLAPRPSQQLEHAAAFFFEHSSSASERGQPLRFSIESGLDHLYGMIISRDLKQNPGCHYIVVVADNIRVRQAGIELRHHHLAVACATSASATYVQGDADVVVAAMVALPIFKNCRFRVKLIEEARAGKDAQAPLSHGAFTQAINDIDADVSVHFASSEGTTGAHRDVLNIWNLVSSPYSVMWKAIIRPPRASYEAHELGASTFLYGNHTFVREDLEIMGAQGALKCSHFFMRGGKAMRSLCVIYLHGNCSSRLEVFSVLPALLCRGMSVFCLDLGGSGLSDGEYVTLGKLEEQDVKSVIEYLRKEQGIGTVALWGRSMGAVAAIFRAAEDPDLAGVVLDSGFSDLEQVMHEYMLSLNLPVPQFMMPTIMNLARKEVLDRVGFDPFELKPERVVKNATCPALFVVAEDDRFILPRHTYALHNAWGGPRELAKVNGGHSGRRPPWFLDNAAEFLLDKLSAHCSRRVHLLRQQPQRTFVV